MGEAEMVVDHSKYSSLISDKTGDDQKALAPALKTLAEQAFTAKNDKKTITGVKIADDETKKVKWEEDFFAKIDGKWTDTAKVVDEAAFVKAVKDAIKGCDDLKEKKLCWSFEASYEKIEDKKSDSCLYKPWTWDWTGCDKDWKWYNPFSWALWGQWVGAITAVALPVGGYFGYQHFYGESSSGGGKKGGMSGLQIAGITTAVA